MLSWCEIELSGCQIIMGGGWPAWRFGGGAQPHQVVSHDTSSNARLVSAHSWQMVPPLSSGHSSAGSGMVLMVGVGLVVCSLGACEAQWQCRDLAGG